ncbi:LOG family protein [Streptomyces sp. NPDC020681]|uniref:LOG family protein n=1 Tax=Streptomyces sp. NPDC020681 TaxID=3365083 RepID=UPI0037A1405F
MARPPSPDRKHQAVRDAPGGCGPHAPRRGVLRRRSTDRSGPCVGRGCRRRTPSSARPARRDGRSGRRRSGAGAPGDRRHPARPEHAAHQRPRAHHAETVEGMAARLDRFLELGNALLALPGSLGTLDELTAVLASAAHRPRPCPVGLLNRGHLYDHRPGQCPAGGRRHHGAQDPGFQRDFRPGSLLAGRQDLQRAGEPGSAGKAAHDGARRPRGGALRPSWLCRPRCRVQSLLRLVPHHLRQRSPLPGPGAGHLLPPAVGTRICLFCAAAHPPCRAGCSVRTTPSASSRRCAPCPRSTRLADGHGGRRRVPAGTDPPTDPGRASPTEAAPCQQPKGEVADLPLSRRPKRRRPRTTAALLPASTSPFSSPSQASPPPRTTTDTSRRTTAAGNAFWNASAQPPIATGTREPSPATSATFTLATMRRQLERWAHQELIHKADPLPRPARKAHNPLSPAQIRRLPELGTSSCTTGCAQSRLALHHLVHWLGPIQGLDPEVLVHARHGCRGWRAA